MKDGNASLLPYQCRVHVAFLSRNDFLTKVRFGFETRQPSDTKKSFIPFSAANLRAFSCIKSPLMGTLFFPIAPMVRQSHRGDFLKDFAVEFRSLENSALAIDETIVRISILVIELILFVDHP